MLNNVTVGNAVQIRRCISLAIEAIDTCAAFQRPKIFLDLFYDLINDSRTEEALEVLEIYKNSFHLVDEIEVTLSNLLGELQISQNLHFISRAEKYVAQLRDIPCVAVTVHDTNETADFPYLDVFAALPQRLHSPRPYLIGKGLRCLPEAISSPRRHYIKRALANAQWETYHYTYEDDYHWEFKVTVVPMFGTEEVITVVQDAADWQSHHWLNKKR